MPVDKTPPAANGGKQDASGMTPERALALKTEKEARAQARNGQMVRGSPSQS